MEIILPVFSSRLKTLRKECHKTQKDIAELLAKTERHYQDIEAGKINVSATTLITPAQYFHVSTDYLPGLREAR